MTVTGEAEEEPIDLEVGFPTDRPIDADGSFDSLGDSLRRLAEWVAAAGLAPAGTAGRST